MVKKLQEELIENISLIPVDASGASGKRALEIINQLKDNINDIITTGDIRGTALDFVRMTDSQGFNTSNKTRINNRTLLELEKAIKDIRGKTLEELEPTQRNIEDIHERIVVVYIDREILSIILDVFLQIRREREAILRVANEGNHIHNHGNTEIEVVRATLDRPSTYVESTTIQQHTRERQNTPGGSSG